jgi:Tol biopolymer transport system component
MTIARGVILGPYEILAHIGAGGMGDVWRARDGRIGRDVAVKVLPAAYAPGDERVRRFEQEARAAGALNHPGLVTIFDVGTMEGSPYIVMELLEGETLRDAIGETMPTPLPLRRAADYAMQIAAALSVAHEKGIIHRDLKPENIFITTDGRVKILDFGLAKLTEDARYPDGRKRSDKHLTSTGMVVGTPGYMSPEQVSAKPLDHRTDIFALGVVLYEMVSGRRAFERDSAVETMTAVLKDEPEPLDPSLPPALEAIVQHCMEKNPRDRFQSARDLAFQLRLLLPEFQNSRTDKLTALPAPAAKTRPTVAILAVAAALALAVAGYALYRLRAAARGPATPRTFKQLTFAGRTEMFPTLSPDGKTFAYVSRQSGNLDIYVQRVDGRTPLNLTSDSKENDSEPAISPDGSQIAFRSEREGGGIFVMLVTGESVRRLTDFGHNPSWSPDGRLVVATEGVELLPIGRKGGSGLWTIDTHSGARKPLVQARVGGPDFGPDSDAVQPSWSPHGKRIAFWNIADSSGHRDLWTIDPDAPRPKETVVRVTSDPAVDWNPVWSADGKYLYFGSDRDGTMNLWRIPMNEESGKPTGAPEPMSLPGSFNAHFSVSQRGSIAYLTTTRAYRMVALPFDARTGKTEAPRALIESSQEILNFRVSPDGRSIAFTTGGQEDVFVAKADGSRLRQLTNDAANDRGVTWAPDGETLYFYSNREGRYQIWTIRADGGGLARVTDDEELRRLGLRAVYQPDPSPDGATLAAQTNGPAVLVHLDRPPGQRIEPLTTADGSTVGNYPRWSPDGKQLIVRSSERPGFGVYSLATRRSEIVSDRGDPRYTPQWLPDSRHVLFFENGNVGIFDLDTRRTTTAPFTLAGSHGWELSKDGSTLFTLQMVQQDDIWMVQLAGE